MKNLVSYSIGSMMLAASMAASAGFVIEGGTANTLTYSTELPHNGFNPNGFGAGKGYEGEVGVVGAKVNWYGNASDVTWTLEYLGKEASWNNEFNFSAVDGNSWKSIFTVQGSKVGATESIEGGSFGFQFLADAGDKGSVSNAEGRDSAPYFWAQTYDEGNTLVLWFSDGGAGNDKDFDDMGVKISAKVSSVPIPAALPLFMSALAGLGFVGFRRRKA
ncbi:MULTISPECIES: VPLPA-CTERM sorting domain-containing protein [Thiorhodovibrio]|uniref:VPLPA-CTERM sorting domain-containing protein n=1 Tax=Thiorhodovibrio TaxID=61593 RepID=UPI001F5DF119|nr:MULTISPECIES: VPLPA-CTERM sorting domain-containing protein [Thiorhodovibrio]WPL10830.1 hypothetical protein Thiosp_00548 [Thiorhodovibrio litoralis]